MNRLRTVLLLLLLSWTAIAQAETALPQVEKELARLADTILNGKNFEQKVADNKRFTSLFRETLQRPESFTYPFDSLKTISRLTAEDRSFRIFTWHILKDDGGEQYHYYFGLVQRKYLNARGETEYIVIPLIELPQTPRGVENMTLDNNNWFGAQYYAPRYQATIPGYQLRYQARPKSSQEPPKEVENTFYLLFGWNGNDEKSNFKLLDVLSFDPERPDRVVFGAEIFFFDVVPKSRAVFRYSENAPFTLNTNYVRMGGKRKLMIVYDHLAAPGKESGLKDAWDMGPDGSYDALEFVNKAKQLYSRKQGYSYNARANKGYFQWYKNVEIAVDPYNKENLREIEQRRYESLKAELGEEKAKEVAHRMTLMEARDAKALEKKLREQREAELRRMRDAGIDLNKNKKQPYEE